MITSTSRLFTALAAIFWYTAVFSQSKPAAIVETGSVIDATTNNPIEGATISFYYSKQSIATNEQGKFSVRQSMQPGDSLFISAIGHERKRISYDDFIKDNRIIISIARL